VKQAFWFFTQMLLESIMWQQGQSKGKKDMEHLLSMARAKGYYASTLQASREGKSLYECPGFQQAAIFKE
jgi:hypothetical protein